MKCRGIVCVGEVGERKVSRNAGHLEWFCGSLTNVLVRQRNGARAEAAEARIGVSCQRSSKVHLDFGDWCFKMIDTASD